DRVNVFLSPDGELSVVPFAALHDGQYYLLDRYLLTYLTSGRDLLRRTDGIPYHTNVEILADPDFAAPAAALSDTERGTATSRRDGGLMMEALRPLPG